MIGITGQTKAQYPGQGFIRSPCGQLHKQHRRAFGKTHAFPVLIKRFCPLRGKKLQGVKTMVCQSTERIRPPGQHGTDQAASQQLDTESHGYRT